MTKRDKVRLLVDKIPEEQLELVLSLLQDLQVHPTRAKSLSDLRLTPEESVLIRSQLLSFESDWNAPGMEAYDAL